MNLSIKGISILAAVVLLSNVLLYVIASPESIDGRFLLTALSLAFAESFLWVSVLAKRFGDNQRKQNQATSITMALGFVAFVVFVSSAIICWMYLAGASYRSILIFAVLMVIFIVVASASLLLLGNKVANLTGIVDSQTEFMRTLQIRLYTLAKHSRSSKSFDLVISNEINRVCEELRYTTPQSLGGCNAINCDLAKLVTELDSIFENENPSCEEVSGITNKLIAALNLREKIIMQTFA